MGTPGERGKWEKRWWWCQLCYWLCTKHTCMCAHTPLMCEGSQGSQSAALNKAFLFLPLIAGSICHWGVQFLISALSETGKVGVGKNTKWMHLLTNEINSLRLHFPFFRQLEQCCSALALSTLSYFPLTRQKAWLTYSQIVRSGPQGATVSDLKGIQCSSVIA